MASQALRGARPFAALLLLVSWPAQCLSHLVCYAFFGPTNDLGWTYVHNLARAWADEVLGTTSKYAESVYFSPESRQREVMDVFIADNCDLIVTGSDTLQPLTMEYANNYPDRKFMCLGGTLALPNMGGAYVRIYQSAYIAGMLAAMQPGVTKAGYVGSMYAPDSLRNVNAFALGMQAVNPDMKLYLMHVGSWFDPRAETIAGLRLFKQHGIDLVTYDSDSTTLVSLAKSLGKYSIAMKSDGTALHGESNLMSMIYVWNSIFVNFVNASMDDAEWAAKKDVDLFVGFERDACSMGTYSSAVPAASRLAAKKMIERFAAKDDPVFCRSFEAFCPEDSGHNFLETLLWKCEDMPIRAPNASAGETCLNDFELRNMNWLIKTAVHDLGLLQVPTECHPGFKMDALAAELCIACPVGTYTDVADALECQPCPTGYYNNLVNASSCKVCPAGSFSNQLGSETCDQCALGETSGGAAVECDVCPKGKYGSQDRTCQNCVAGSHASSPSTTECAPCPKGTYSDSGAAECSLCPIGYYRDEVGGIGIMSCSMCPRSTFSAFPGAEHCTSCPEGFTTADIASSASSSCVCAEGLYQPLGKQICEPCPAGMACPTGSSEANFASAQPNPLLKPGFWSSVKEPMSIFECASASRCAGGTPGVSSCTGGLEAQACSHCAEGAVWDGTGCRVCKDIEASYLLFPILPLLLSPVLILGLYLTSRSEYERWGSWRNGIASAAFVMLNFYQIVNLIGSVNVHLPGGLHDVCDFWSWTSDLYAIFKAECQGLGGIQIAMVLKTIAPALLGIMFCLCYAVSMLLSKGLSREGLRLDGGMLMNCFFSLIFTFFAAISAMAFTLFKCTNNPNGKMTLVADRSINCFEDDWNGMLGVSLVAILVWCIGCGLLFACQIKRSASQFHNTEFQRRWKFLFIKYRPDVEWWSIVFVAKGIMLNLGFLLVSTGIGQIYWIITVLLTYLCLVLTFQPWRHSWVTVLDTWAHISLILTAATFTWFASSSVPLESRADADRDMKNLGILCTFLSMPLFFTVLGFLTFRGQSQETQQKQAAKIAEAHKIFANTALADEASFLSMAKFLNDTDFRCFYKASQILSQELFRIKARRGYSNKSLGGSTDQLSEVKACNGGLRVLDI